jgi:hypothetical protein
MTSLPQDQELTSFFANKRRQELGTGGEGALASKMSGTVDLTARSTSLERYKENWDKGRG